MSHPPGHAKANTPKYSIHIHTADFSKPNPEMEAKLGRSKVEGHLRTFAKEDAEEVLKTENPFTKIVGDYYEQRVREIRAKTFIPPVIPRFSTAARHFANFFDERLKVNCERFLGGGGGGCGIIPFIYKCPHPTGEEMDAFQGSWEDDGEAYKSALKKAEKVSPDIKWGFLPNVVFGVGGHTAVMICVLLVGSPKE